ncbi:MAG: hypothetical protein ACTS73_07840 [Arsenophonus sp. NEOnobi-MAG3]
MVACLYLLNISTEDFHEALWEFLGEKAHALSANTPLQQTETAMASRAQAVPS